ncbi:hypothetical protein VE03_01692 [Pseudogymnoascus sp. 23342-1-I1]|nr:hypothetical protein VE03_01692 [Pseudogymnoascus sp. 23342-1-I1]
MQSFTTLTTDTPPSPSLHQRTKYPSTTTTTTTSSSPLTPTASPMSVLQPSHNTTASPTSWRISLLSIITPALRFSLSLAYTTQLLLTLTLSFLLSHGLYASKALAVNAYHASRIFVINAWHTAVFVGINLFYASRAAALLGLRSGWAVGGHGWVVARDGVRGAWKRTERARARVFFEFMVWLLHPSPLVLFIFWPGWIFVFMGVGYYYYC